MDFGIFTWHLRVLVRSFVLFRFKESIARNHRTFDFNLVLRILSYPSLTERERKRERFGDRTWEQGWIDFTSYLHTNTGEIKSNVWGRRETSDSCHIKTVQNNSYGRTWSETNHYFFRSNEQQITSEEEMVTISFYLKHDSNLPVVLHFAEIQARRRRNPRTLFQPYRTLVGLWTRETFNSKGSNEPSFLLRHEHVLFNRQ